MGFFYSIEPGPLFAVDSLGFHLESLTSLRRVGLRRCKLGAITLLAPHIGTLS